MMNRTTIVRVSRAATLAAIVALASSSGTWAQAGKGTADQTIPNAGSATDDAKPGAAAPGGTLTDKLNRTDGVIAPPGNVDPEMRQAPPPGAGQNMPVIPPSAVDPAPPNAAKPEAR
jgi:hypothetical protein